MPKRRHRFVRSFYTFLILFITLLCSGLAGYFILWSQHLGKGTQQAILYLLEGSPEATAGDMLSLKSTLDLDPDIYRTEYISPERLVVLLQDDGLMSSNADAELVEELPSYLAVQFTTDVYAREGVEAKLAHLRQLDVIEGVYTQPGLLEQIQANVLRLGSYLGWLGLLVWLFAGFLLTNILKLHLFSDRHEIKTMQLTGASPSYIRRPYLRRNTGLAFWAGLTAIFALLGLHVYLSEWMFGGKESLYWMGMLAGGVLLLGLGLAWMVTSHTVNRYIFADIESIF
jgi:cell division transport system permease protein